MATRDSEASHSSVSIISCLKLQNFNHRPNDRALITVVLNEDPLLPAALPMFQATKSNFDWQVVPKAAWAAPKPGSRSLPCRPPCPHWASPASSTMEAVGRYHRLLGYVAREHRDSYRARRTSQPPRKTMKTAVDKKAAKKGWNYNVPGNIDLRSWKWGEKAANVWLDIQSEWTSGSNGLEVHICLCNSCI